MIERVPVAEDGIVGTLFRTSASSLPAIVLPGSEGGTPEHVAQLLAKDEGLAALALGYFGLPPLPKYLVEVPLEYVEAAAGWLCRQPGVKDAPVVLVGGSKGAELALSVAAHLPERFGAVVAFAPSCVAWAGVEFVAKDRRFLSGLFGTASRRSSWSLGGDPLPFLHHAEGVLPAVSHRGISVARSFTVALDRAAWPNPAAIPVERANGPILLISGADDRMWPSTRMAKLLVQRSDAAGRPDHVRHLCFPDAGHRLGPRTPPRGIQRFSGIIDYGGSRQADIDARAEAWAATRSFFTANRS
jgi:dienelactone hydrolase